MHPAEIRKKRDKTPDEALAALMRLCARAEKSEGDARRLMRGFLNFFTIHFFLFTFSLFTFPGFRSRIQQKKIRLQKQHFTFIVTD